MTPKAQRKEERLAHARRSSKSSPPMADASTGEPPSARSDELRERNGYTGGEVSRLELRRGRVFYLDSYTGKAIYTHKTTWSNDWKGFSNGGTLRSLVEDMRDYVLNGTPISRWKIGIPRDADSLDNNIWGYDEADLKLVRDAAFALPIIQTHPA